MAERDGARRTPRGHRHVEAFCRMQYEDTAGNVEWIWNSRDGVTPFITMSRAGLESQHVRWNEDQYAPSYQPAPGERIFVDLTMERAREIARGLVSRWWDDGEYPMSRAFKDPEEAIERLAARYHDGGAQPDCVEAKDWKSAEIGRG